MSRSVFVSIISTLDRNVRKKCQLRVHLGQHVGVSPAARAAARPEPTPNQPGTICRDWVQPNTHGIARRPPSPAPAFGPLGRPGADVERAEQLGRRGRPEVRRQVRVLDQRRGRRGTPRRRPRPSPRPTWPASPAAGGASVCSSVAWSTAATVSSRFSRASAGSVYLSEMTSPCSVTLIAPSSVPYGWARIASCVGPPPRPTVPPRPWKSRSRTPCRAATSRSARCARWIAHWTVVMPASLLESE